jgi:hypothetical protein
MPHFGPISTQSFVECGQNVGKRKTGPTALHEKVLVGPALFGAPGGI